MTDQRSWLEVYAHPRVAGMTFLGFSSGLPFLLVFSTLSAWLTQAGISLATIGHFSLIGTAYSLKFLWAPLIDRIPLPLLTRYLGRRRGWMLLAQIIVGVALANVAFCDPADNIERLTWLTIAVAFASATQDICIDAWRIEAVEVERQGAMAAAYQFGYRIALLVAGAGALFIAQGAGWSTAYLTMAALMGVGVITTLLIPEPQATIDRAALSSEARVIEFLNRSQHWSPRLRHAAAWFIGAVICPFLDFLQRYGFRTVLFILFFVAVYRMPYATMGVMAYPFYLHSGFTLDQIAAISKIFGVGMTMIGAFAGGVLVAKIGLARSMIIGALLVMAANLYFAVMAEGHPTTLSLTGAIALDNFGGGIEGTAFIAYLSGLTSTAYTATQFALFSSWWSLPSHLVGSVSGDIVDAVGYPLFFVYTAVLTIPALLLLAWSRPVRSSAVPAGTSSA